MDTRQDDLFIPRMPLNANPPISIERRVAWSDTDAAGRWHYSTAFEMFEAAEVELLVLLGMSPDVIARLPRVHVRADFKSVLSFFDSVVVRATIESVGTSSITLGFSITHGRTLAATGEIVCVHLDESGKPSPLPAAFLSRIREFIKLKDTTKHGQ